MVDSVEGFANINADSRSSQWWFALVEPVGDAGDSGKKSGYTGVGGAETVLSGGRGERGSDEGEDKAFKDLRDRAEKGDRAVRGGVRSGFARFRDGKDEGLESINLTDFAFAEEFHQNPTKNGQPQNCSIFSGIENVQVYGIG